MAYPIVVSVSPDSGVAGDTVTITGFNFSAATDVLFDGVSVSGDFGIVDNWTIVAIVPAHANGATDVVVTNATGASDAGPASVFLDSTGNVHPLYTDVGSGHITYSVTGPFSGGANNLAARGDGASFGSQPNIGASMPDAVWDVSTFSFDYWVDLGATASAFGYVGVAVLEASPANGWYSLMGIASGSPTDVRIQVPFHGNHTFGTNLARGAWHHVGFKWDGSAWTYYLDGSAIATNSTPAPTFASDLRVLVGGAAISPLMLGDMAGVAVYPTDLADSAFAAHAAANSDAATYKASVLSDSPTGLWMLEAPVTIGASFLYDAPPTSSDFDDDDSFSFSESGSLGVTGGTPTGDTSAVRFPLVTESPDNRGILTEGGFVLLTEGPVAPVPLIDSSGHGHNGVYSPGVEFGMAGLVAGDTSVGVDALLVTRFYAGLDIPVTAGLISGDWWAMGWAEVMASGNGVIVSFEPAVSVTTNFAFGQYSPGNYRIVIQRQWGPSGGEYETTATSPFALADGGHFFAMSYNAALGEFSTYVDGSPQEVIAVTGNAQTLAPTSVRVGGAGTAGSPARFDEIAYGSGTISDGDVAAVYAAALSSFADLTAAVLALSPDGYFHLDDSSSSGGGGTDGGGGGGVTGGGGSGSGGGGVSVDGALPPPGGYLSIEAVGFLPRSDAAAAALVHVSTWEPRLDNFAANHTVPTQPATLGFFSDFDDEWNATYRPLITGNYTGTTDSILQWACAKWGWNDEYLRAEMIQESDWHQSSLGDFEPASDGHRVFDRTDDPTPTSFSIIQNKWYFHPDGVASNSPLSSYPRMLLSTAFALDIFCCMMRGVYNGHSSFLNGGGMAAAGDAWGAIGYWFSGGWHDPDAEDYISRVQGSLADKIWLDSGF